MGAEAFTCGEVLCLRHGARRQRLDEADGGFVWRDPLGGCQRCGQVPICGRIEWHAAHSTQIGDLKQQGAVRTLPKKSGQGAFRKLTLLFGRSSLTLAQQARQRHAGTPAVGAASVLRLRLHLLRTQLA